MPVELNRTIHPKDTMLRRPKGEPQRDRYFRCGKDALRLIQSVLALSRVRTVSKILDLPCGYGRVARYLRLAFPNAHLTFCDLLEEGVQFCVREFNGDGLISKVDLRELNFPGKYDIIADRRFKLRHEVACVSCSHQGWEGEPPVPPGESTGLNEERPGQCAKACRRHAGS